MEEARSQGNAEISIEVGSLPPPQFSGDQRIDFQRRGSRVVQQLTGRLAECRHLGDQFPHLVRAGPGRGLIGHGREPFHQALGKNTGQQGHQHQADRAVSPDIGLGPRIAGRHR